MVGMEDEDQVHRLGEHRIDLEVLRRHGEAEPEEIGGVVEVVARIHEGLAHGIFVGPACDGRHLGDHPVGRHGPVPGILDVDAVMVEGRERADHAAHHRHRVRIAPETPIDVVDLVVQHRVMRDVVNEFRLLFRVRKLAEQDEVAGLHIVGVLGQLLYGVAAVEQHALIAVDIGNLGLAASRRGVARVEGEVAKLPVEGADVDDVRSQSSAHDRQFNGLVVRPIHDGNAAAGHLGCHPFSARAPTYGGAAALAIRQPRRGGGRAPPRGPAPPELRRDPATRSVR